MLRDEADKEAHGGVDGDEGEGGGARRAGRQAGGGGRLGAQAVLHGQLDHDAQEALGHLVALRGGGGWGVVGGGGRWGLGGWLGAVVGASRAHRHTGRLTSSCRRLQQASPSQPRHQHPASQPPHPTPRSPP